MNACCHSIGLRDGCPYLPSNESVETFRPRSIDWRITFAYQTHIARWRSLEMRDDCEYAAERSTQLFRIVEELDVPCGYERSFKILDRKILANRFLIGINTDSVSRDSLVDACCRLDMPQRFRDQFAAELPNANLVFLGFEDNEPGCIYKVYLEFWEKLKRELQTAPATMPTTLHLGFKWRTDDPTQASISNYRCVPQLSLAEILDRSDRIYQGTATEVTASVTRAIIRAAAERLLLTDDMPSPFIYLEVSEEASARKSFDINLYPAGLRVREIETLLSRIAGHYRVPPEKLDRLFPLVRNRLLGHLSGGINRAEQSFLTVYYEVQ